MSTPSPLDVNHQLEAALQRVERTVALVCHAKSQGRLPPADAQKILEAAEAFAVATLF